MEETYGKLVLPKGSILYHTSKNPFETKSEETFPMLFCVFHPSDYENNFVTKIVLKKDISLFFAIDFVREIIDKKKISTPINVMKKITKSDFFIKYVEFVKNYLSFFSNELKKNNFDGWVGLPKIGFFVEVCLINNEDIFEVLSSEHLIVDYQKESINFQTKEILQKNWGQQYSICFEKINIKLCLNIRYEKRINLYKKNMKKKKFKHSNTLELLIENSEITYHNGNFCMIEWDFSGFEEKGFCALDRWI